MPSTEPGPGPRGAGMPLGTGQESAGDVFLDTHCPPRALPGGFSTHTCAEGQQLGGGGQWGRVCWSVTGCWWP